MAVLRFRDVTAGLFGEENLGCLTSATLTISSDILRARCGATISERYQGLTNISVEIVIETLDPFIDIHPGAGETLSFEVPAATPGTGGPATGGVEFVFETAILTTHAGRIEKDSLGTGTYTFRAISSDGSTLPVECGIAGTTTEVTSVAGFIRDIGDFTFSGEELSISTPDFCARSFEFSENSELIEDFCQGDIFATYVGITGLNLTATAVGRNLRDHFPGCIEGGIGSKGSISFSVLTGSETNCTDLEPGGSVSMDRMNINEASVTARHGEMAEVSISWVGHGESGAEAIASFTPA